MTDNPTKPERSREGPDLTFTIVEPRNGAAAVAVLLVAGFVLNALFGTGVMSRILGIAGLAIGIGIVAVRPLSRTNRKLVLVDFALALLVLLQAWHPLGNWPR